MEERKKYNIKLNNLEKIEQLLQETYNLACQQHKQIQDEINKLVNTTEFDNLDIDGKEKYGKIMQNYMALQQKSIGQKFDIAKLLAEVAKHGGDVNGALNDMKNTPSTLDIGKLRELAKNINTKDDGAAEKYNIKP